jgi:hypothetical protein
MLTFGKISGGWGVLFLITALITWKIATPTYALVEGGIGLLLLMVYFGTHRGLASASPKDQANQRASFFWVSTVLIAVVSFAILVAVNFIVAKKGKTVDLTNKKIYSLAPQTLQALKGLKEPVRAIGFMETKSFAYDAYDSLFKRFAQESDKFTYEFKDPKKSLEDNAKYQIKEGQTTVIVVRGKGPTESHTSLPAGPPSEQDLTNALLKLNSTGTQKVYFLTGHAEYPITPPGEASPTGQAPSVSELSRASSKTATRWSRSISPRSRTRSPPTRRCWRSSTPRLPIRRERSPPSTPTSRRAGGCCTSPTMTPSRASSRRWRSTGSRWRRASSPTRSTPRIRSRRSARPPTTR